MKESKEERSVGAHVIDRHVPQHAAESPESRFFANEGVLRTQELPEECAPPLALKGYRVVQQVVG